MKLRTKKVIIIRKLKNDAVVCMKVATVRSRPVYKWYNFEEIRCGKPELQKIELYLSNGFL